MLSFATEEISLHVGETLGGLLNASFGNAVELIVAVIALAKGEVLIVQTSLIGSILSNLLTFDGWCYHSDCLQLREHHGALHIAAISRGTAIILLTVYAAYLYFQLKTHHVMFDEENQKVPRQPPRKPAVPHKDAVAALAKASGATAAAAGIPFVESRPDSDKLFNSDACKVADDPSQRSRSYIF
ncbi:hypothetical protein ACMFMF_011882 [Clarireedia jacksonii]